MYNCTLWTSKASDTCSRQNQAIQLALLGCSTAPAESSQHRPKQLQLHKLSVEAVASSPPAQAAGAADRMHLPAAAASLAAASAAALAPGLELGESVVQGALLQGVAGVRRQQRHVVLPCVLARAAQEEMQSESRSLAIPQTFSNARAILLASGGSGPRGNCRVFMQGLHRAVL